jgi:hypothetical protein
MRLARKLFLLGAMVLGVLTLMASSASAVSVHEEDGGDCGTVANAPNGHGTPSGGCRIFLTNAERIELGTGLGMILCDTVFEAAVGDDGEGFIYGHDIFNCTSSVTECNEAGVADNWPVHLNTEDSMELTYCLISFGFLTTGCHLADITASQTIHSEMEFSTNDVHQFCEGSDSSSVDGHWLTVTDETHPELVIEH